MYTPFDRRITASVVDGLFNWSHGKGIGICIPYSYFLIIIWMRLSYMEFIWFHKITLYGETFDTISMNKLMKLNDSKVIEYAWFAEVSRTWWPTARCLV